MKIRLVWQLILLAALLVTIVDIRANPVPRGIPHRNEAECLNSISRYSQDICQFNNMLKHNHFLTNIGNFHEPVVEVERAFLSWSSLSESNTLYYNADTSVTQQVHFNRTPSLIHVLKYFAIKKGTGTSIDSSGNLDRMSITELPTTGRHLYPHHDLLFVPADSTEDVHSFFAAEEGRVTPYPTLSRISRVVNCSHGAFPRDINLEISCWYIPSEEKRLMFYRGYGLMYWRKGVREGPVFPCCGGSRTL